MKNIRMVARGALAVAAATFLVACGGGSDDATAVSAEGIWVGSVGGDTDADRVLLVVLGDGTYYGVYGDATGTYGLIQGTASSSGNNLVSGNGRDYGFGMGVPYGFSLSATVSSQSSLVGTATYAAPILASVSYALSYDSSYGDPVTLLELAGAYSGTVGSLAGVSLASLTISTTGALAAVSDTGCRVSGQLSPRGSTAVFDLTAALDAATCGQAINVQGIAGLTGVDRNALAFAAVTADRSDALFGVASRP
ncbi:MAG TPA: hypothetical protein PKC60_05785 [Hydrogenophaga sp.]|uniref:hypothetical protein n=1 Tax=Hydrogenophaga sp. TaxID=1904254 RepID=UPI002CD8CB83|nr:hypothetical protein [Hydrogenophaga sp.]HMN92725.1 hypothetical protein [Hydrogenophaga sp.]HMP08883.1 hypothetical protein [Hydrogenophaga sp.]